MPVQFTVRHQKDADYYLEKSFTGDVILIGRDEANDLVLKDKRKTVSRKHAEIRLDDGIYFLMDMGSRNGTYINDHKLNPEQPYAIEHGTEIAIGEYILSVFLQYQHQSAGSDATVFVTNPFLEDAREMLPVLEKINQKYAIEDSETRDEYLIQAVHEVLGEQEDSSAVEAIGKAFGTQPGQNQPVSSISSTSQKNNNIEEYSVEYSLTTGTVLELFLGTLIKVQQFISQFYSEFIGATKVDTGDSLHTKTVDALKDYLFHPDLPPEMMQKRIEVLKRKIDEMNKHQVALLDGYRSAVREGAREMLHDLNPAIIKNKIKQERISLGLFTIPVSFIPLYTSLKTIQVLQKKHYELSSEDRGVVEKKYFRGVFSKQYLESMNEQN